MIRKDRVHDLQKRSVEGFLFLYFNQRVEGKESGEFHDLEREIILQWPLHFYMVTKQNKVNTHISHQQSKKATETRGGKKGIPDMRLSRVTRESTSRMKDI